MQRIIIIGTTGSGKSTLAKKISDKTNIPFQSLDALFWKANWQESSDSEIFNKIEAFLANKKSWIIDGNYTRTQHITWTKADTIIWLDLPFYLNFYQSISRAISRIIHQQELWEGTGNKESLQRLLSKDSILIWIFKCFWKNKAKYKLKISDPENQHLQFIRLKSRREINQFLKNIDIQQ